MLSIQTNLLALYVQRQLATTTLDVQRSTERLASGLRIRTAADDPTGLVVAERLRVQLAALSGAKSNVDNAEALVQTADGYLNELDELVVGLREVLTRAGNDTLTPGDRALLNEEYRQLALEAQRIVNTSKYKENFLFNTATGLAIQIGAGAAEVLQLQRRDLRNSVGLVVSSDLTTSVGRSASETAITNFVNQVDDHRARLGASANRLASIARSTQVAIDNLALEASRIRDVDVAAETALLARNQILQQAQVALLAQANLQGELVLHLFGFAGG
jgi:flagellin